MADRRSVLVTRPRADAERTAAGLAALGLDPIIAPMLEERFTGVALPDATGFAAIALTSANGVRALAAHPQGEEFSALRVYAVGEHTAAEARAAGFDHVSLPRAPCMTSPGRSSPTALREKSSIPQRIINRAIWPDCWPRRG